MKMPPKRDNSKCFSTRCKLMVLISFVMAPTVFASIFASIQKGSSNTLSGMQSVPFCSRSAARPILSSRRRRRRPRVISNVSNLLNHQNERALYIPRGGAKVEIVEDGDDDDEEEEEGKVEEYDEDSDAYDEDYSEEEAEEASNDDTATVEEEVAEYDEPLVPSPMLQMYTVFGVILLSKRVDLYHPTVVRIARFAFVGYIILLQLFLLFVRIRAKMINDRTPIDLSNPFNTLIQSQLENSGVVGGENGSSSGSAGMVKNLASSILSSKSTVVEYDLKQARSMQGGLLMNMCFMWFLHFKMEQVQPLIIQTVSNTVNLIYSPLFQVYVLKRNLERPFKNPQQPLKAEATAAAEEQTEGDAKEAEEEDVSSELKEKEDEDKDDEKDDEDEDDEDNEDEEDHKSGEDDDDENDSKDDD